MALGAAGPYMDKMIIEAAGYGAGVDYHLKYGGYEAGGDYSQFIDVGADSKDFMMLLPLIRR